MLIIGRNIVISVMLHSIFLAAVFMAENSSGLEVKRLIDVSLLEEWKGGLHGSKSEASLQQRPKIKSVKAADIKPRAQLITSHDISGQKETFKSTPQAEVKPLPAVVGNTVKSVSSNGVLAGLSGADSKAVNLSVGSGDGFATQGMARAVKGAISGDTVSTQLQDSSDVLLRHKIRDAIQSNLVYPYIARKRGITGTALVAFKINQKGVPEDFVLIKSSGYAILDAAAKETVFKSSPFPARDYTIEKIPITYLLKGD